MHPAIRHTLALTSAAVLVTSIAGCRQTGWPDEPGRTAAADATGWLVDQQLPDGGFEVAAFPGFETSDAVMAIAEDAQQQAAWDPAQAFAAVTSASVGGNTALDALDDLADGPVTPGQAAKIVALAATPLGLSPTAFDPEGDGARDLVAVMTGAATPNGSYGAFTTTTQVVIALRAAGQPVSAATVTLVRQAQQSSGGWDFQGDPAGDTADVDSTAMAIQALVAGRAGADDAAVLDGLAYLADAQLASGAWPSFGQGDPNATAMAVLAISAVGFDPASPCWRDTVAPHFAGSAYTSPTAWLRDQQQPDGRIASPADGWGVNTFATSQTIQALRRAWVPVGALAAKSCG